MPAEDFTFHLVYDGEDITSGSIDARDLAPALLAFADLVDYGARVIVPEAPPVTVRVRSDFQRGSFDVALQLAHAYDRFVSLFSGNQVQAWATLLSLLGVSGAGLFQLIKRSKGRKPQVVTIERSERVTITFDGENREDIPEGVWQLFNHPGVRRAVEKIVEPLNAEGIDKLELKKDGDTMLHVNKEEAPYFKAPEQNADESIFETPNAMLVVLSPSFRQGNKWRLHDGTKAIWVAVEDAHFMAAVDSGREAFRKGDLLHVTLETRQWIEGRDLRAEYTIRKVHRHENRLDDPNLPDTNGT